MIDAITLQRLAEITIQERLQQAENDRMVRQMSRSSLPERFVASIANWARKTVSTPKSVRYSPVAKRSYGER